ncbi:MAG TPA: TMEM165/GDT1 family protein [Casimicrobiaceae bacterium]|jgi:putative Ca2+/H+ antiporter (TMEM165/GDT1 family)|nr:TMEM165/GDT1 family protein [Casimicrobiaceae bacterium]
MEAFLVSLLVVAVGEMGDKTQFLALVLAARFRRALPIVCGIFVAALANHTLAGLVGAGVRQAVPATYLRWLLAASFLAVALWALVPERQNGRDAVLPSRLGVFSFTVLAFFLAEIGDKTQIATIVLAARFDNLFAVIAGTTLGMLAADVPVVWLGHAAASRIPLRALRLAAAGLFAVLAVVTLFA